jgi:hypothetical protein
MNYPVTNLVCYDLEVYPNYFLAGFRTPTGEVFQYTQDNVAELRKLPLWLHTNSYTLCGYNSNGYDDLVLDEFIATGSMKAAYVRSLQIIEHGLKPWDLPSWPTIQSIDLMPIIPGWHSLKKMGVSLGAHKLQELPVNPKKELTHEQMIEIAKYNLNDLEVTQLLLERLQPELDLRAELSERYQIDLRSRGEAQIAERVLLKRAGLTGSQLKTLARQRVSMTPVVHIKPPSWWHEVNLMKSKNLCEVYNIGQQIFNTPIRLNNYQYPKGTLDRQVFLGDRYYQMGVGGLHSVDGPGCWKPATHETMYDFDVASYYPSIILQEGLEPVQWQGKFLPVYQEIVQERLAAKASGDKTTADVLKIVANGSFGKFGDQYSALFDPTMLAHVTVYGQLGLLLLIAALVDAGQYVVSANTDGITVIVNDKAHTDRIIKAWEQKTGMVMEEIPYHALYQQNVNNYLAVKTAMLPVCGPGIKAKGALMPERDVRHSPNADVCARAVCDSLSKGIDISDTINSELNINQFILATQVRGAWKVTYGGEPLGKMVRWYKSTADLPKIMRTPLDEWTAGNEGQLPDSAGGRPVPDLPVGFPMDLDYRWYINRALSVYGKITTPKVRGMNERAHQLYQQGLQPVLVDPTAKRFTRHRRVEGDTDFSSVPPGWCLGVSTGKGTGWLAMVDGDDVALFKVDKDYPSRTRAKILKDHGFELHYGANVPITGKLVIEKIESDFDKYYTEAELKKVRG